MTATIIGTTTAASTGNPVLTVASPEGVAAGDVLVAALRGQQAYGPWDAPGWTVIGPPIVTGSDQRANQILARTASSSDPGEWVFIAPDWIRHVVLIVALRGVTLPPSGRSPSYAGTAISATGRSTEPYVEGSGTGAYVIWAGGSEFAAGNPHVPISTPVWHDPIGYAVTQEATTASRTYVWVGGRAVEGDVPAASIAWTAPSGQAAQSVALPLALPVHDPGPGLEVHITDDTGTPAPHRLYIQTVDGPVTPDRLLTIPHGYPSVQDMLHGEFWWAHRGGSHSYPEHSLYAYSQSVIRGYGALEISLGRTSDGVWVGLHDATIDRTSGITGAPPISQMTWDDLMAYQIVTGDHGAPQPYMAWDELIGTYGASHVLICDPKYAVGDHWPEFLDRCVSDIGVDRCIVKWSAGLGWLADAARTRGLTSWGYAYEDYLDDPETVAALPHWDLLGMEWSASQQAWDTILGYGVPVVAHVLYSEAHVTAARAKGAAGYQIAATATVTPGR